MTRRHRLGIPTLIALGAVVAFATGCGSSDIATPGPSTGDGSDSDRCPSPDVARLPPVSLPSEAAREGARQALLQGDADRARQYGQAHPDAFNDVWFDYRDGEWILVVGFKSAVDEHRAALLALLEHPDSVVVCRTSSSAADQMKILADIRALPNDDGQISSYGARVDRIFVNVRADLESLAKQLYEKYAPAIDITVGARPYPPGAASTDGFPCPELAPAATPTGVRVTVEPSSVAFTSGANSKATVRIRNSSTAAVAGSRGLFSVVRPGTRTVVGMYVGARDLVLRTFDVGPGGESSFEDTYGTAPCGPGDRYTLPKGTYELLATVDINGIGTVVSEPARIDLR